MTRWRRPLALDVAGRTVARVSAEKHVAKK
jgi:hypothetical protein